LPYQIDTVNKVVNEMNGRAILADEVGLGKTIEAGLILKEYLARGLVNKFLILVPASLGFQWTYEMVNKFKINDIFFNRKGRGWAYFDHQIASLDLAKRGKHAKYLNEIYFDMIIVDEAHKLKNRDTLNWKFVNNLNKKYLLLLTATPIQNSLEDLYSLISLLYPDLYTNFNIFKEKYIPGKHCVKDSNKLKKELDDIMIRNSRIDTGLKLPERHIYQYLVELNPEERELYEKLSTYVKNEYINRKNTKSNILNLIIYQREICSSSFALQRTLTNSSYLTGELIEINNLASKIRLNNKIKIVEEILKKVDGQVIIFTEFRATQEYIAYYLEEKGYKTILFNGGYSLSGKEWVKYIFQKEKDVLISTEAGSQGLNLQFSNVIINYDLPWNPMKLEQRIGRIHRLGQNRDVYIYNLATKDTIEEKILKILYEKINLFKKVLGNMEKIIVESDNFQNIERNIMQIIGESKNNDEIENRLYKLSKKIEVKNKPIWN
jgi:SNF2 family DNA or RNA helicase